MVINYLVDNGSCLLRLAAVRLLLALIVATVRVLVGDRHADRVDRLAKLAHAVRRGETFFAGAVRLDELAIQQRLLCKCIEQKIKFGSAVNLNLICMMQGKFESF